ncbi:diacylglycerol kinase family protein [uncultured Alistipes sp.]|jgi:hypothetical protein|uniref:diacylglycerol kinase family protein n=1 Tax=uncultured Alistipes sp. TaxID=538949 RepID=UPI0025EF6846|nr:diacylglycerol kinase family protein [uncultured Alistipes sp.]
MKNNGFTFRKRLESFKHAFRGIKRLFTHEANSRIHLFITTCVLIAGIWLRLDAWEWISVILAIGFVLSAEAFNSAVESLGDAISREPNDFVKHAKDLAAGAVLLSAITAAIVGIIIFLPKII